MKKGAGRKEISWRLHYPWPLIALDHDLPTNCQRSQSNRQEHRSPLLKKISKSTSSNLLNPQWSNTSDHPCSGVPFSCSTDPIPIPMAATGLRFHPAATFFSAHPREAGAKHLLPFHHCSPRTILAARRAWLLRARSFNGRPQIGASFSNSNGSGNACSSCCCHLPLN
jgi:hypothetical protein